MAAAVTTGRVSGSAKRRTVRLGHHAAGGLGGPLAVGLAGGPRSGGRSSSSISGRGGGREPTARGTLRSGVCSTGSRPTRRTFATRCDAAFRGRCGIPSRFEWPRALRRRQLPHRIPEPRSGGRRATARRTSTSVRRSDPQLVGTAGRWPARRATLGITAPCSWTAPTSPRTPGQGEFLFRQRRADHGQGHQLGAAGRLPLPRRRRACTQVAGAWSTTWAAT